MELTEREKAILSAALNYMRANVDDVNDTFAHYTEEDEDNEAGLIAVEGEVQDSFEEEEITVLFNKLVL